jgi:hypothetical protein
MTHRGGPRAGGATSRQLMRRAKRDIEEGRIDTEAREGARSKLRRGRA